MLRENYIKEKLESGNAVIGTWSVIPSPVVTDIIASAGLDFIIIDAEHGPVTFETAQEMVIACESRQVSPIMRVGDICEVDILRALDIGVHGIQIPNITNANDVHEIVRYAKYPPLGNRGYSPFTRAGGYALENAKTLPETANENTLVGINVEGKEAIENIDTILSIEDLDIVFVGLFDLSKALGIPGRVTDQSVIDYLKQLTGKINEAGKYPGTIATNVDQIKTYTEIGIKYLVYLVDCDMLRSAYADISSRFKSIKNV